MNLYSPSDLIERLRRGKSQRERFVESHLSKSIASQIRAIRDRFGWSQSELAAEVGMSQNAISRLESAEYGRPTIRTLQRLAAAFDVALIVRFVPFSELVHWVSGTPYLNRGLTTQSLAVPTFCMEEGTHVFDSILNRETRKLEGVVAANQNRVVEVRGHGVPGEIPRMLPQRTPTGEIVNQVSQERIEINAGAAA